MNELKRNKKIVVMLTGGGGAGTIHIIKNHKKYGIYKTIAVDSNPHAVGLYIADKGHKVPLCTDDRYLDSISEIIRASGSRPIPSSLINQFTIFTSFSDNFCYSYLKPFCTHLR